ncbi:glycosyltransferase [Micromonospora narathiwatensis]|uniref:UDP-N-acetylglucosamine transferase subunit ALG13 n=1 Tax=Micromonospora narathiwatensis TaxID=299146 RepID=A0A1A9A909_9ACTN|nr:glycosyltransferase [Micromonospora narathiwatensis]SBT52966.1 UDP-N-acetylglucosamine transferase subunit ALG13 [Micromonospora narathiwatensis]
MSVLVPGQREGRDATPYVLAVVGTDVHRFDRLVDWLERWHAGRPTVRVVLQYGHSRTPRLPEARPFLGHEELQRAMAEATLVVSHGGPATITEARRTSHLPIVVPRDPAHDEHVDNHQQLFSRRLGAAGMVRLCESEAELVAALDEGLADPYRFTLAADRDRPDPRAEAVARVGRVIDDLVARRVRQRAGGRRR